MSEGQGTSRADGDADGGRDRKARDVPGGGRGRRRLGDHRAPIFHYSDIWQLVINTGTTIVTFLMVFLIQATQNRDTLALQIKLSELILALEGARNAVPAVEQQPEGALTDIAEEIHERAAIPDAPAKGRRAGDLHGQTSRRSGAQERG